ncbi:MAG: prolyl oligopeptidase family serine peptidase [Streptosporangiales bacterium]|nr:prolyl oligopeptidase family serine peptidase [Streptosporangiales bacterium]
MSEHDELSFPRHAARTRRFTLGTPRSFTVTEDGRTVHFLRSRGGTDPMTCLWALDVRTGDETLLADPVALLDGGQEDLPPEERALRERSREAAGGVVAYSTDRAGSTLAFGLGGGVYAVRDGGTPVRLDTAVPAIGPRVDPTGQRVGYVHGGAFHVAELSGGRQVLAEPEDADVSYGLAEFIAAEEMSRTRGFWWAPDGTRALVARVDESPVQRWYIADPAHPERKPVEHAYPAAGTANADVRLFVLGLDGSRVEVHWDRARFEYLARVSWSTYGALIAVQSRDQRTVRVLRIDPATGNTAVEREDSDPAWVELVGGVPAWCGDRLVWVTDVDGWRRLVVDGEPVTPDGTQVRHVLAADDDGVLVSASIEPTEVQVLEWRPEGTLTAVSTGPGVHTAVRAGGTTVVTSSTLDSDQAQSTVTVRSTDTSWLVRSFTDTPAVRPAVELLRAGDRELRTAVLFPTGHQPGSARLPVLLDPYGGPHAQRVLASRRMFYESQWFADQGFAVVIADGRGTPGRCAAWERAVHGDLATPVLDDQVAALEAAAAAYPDLDLDRVGIRGWSFGGYLAALAVLRRPDLFHVGIAGAPVTDLTLYDTHYQERYLGDPGTSPETYRRSSIIDDAPNLSRPLLIIHGLVDDNVVVAHTLRLSGALLAAGRPHTVLPLTGITHMATQETVAENLLNVQVAFLRDALG